MQQQSNHLKFCVDFWQPSLGPPMVIPGTISPTPTIIGTTCQYSSPDTSTNRTTTTSDRGSVLNCPHGDLTFTSRIGLVGHLRIHRTETGEPVPGALTHSMNCHIHCPHCPHAFTHCIGLFGHIRIHDSGIHRNVDSTDILCTLSTPAILTTTTTTTTTTTNDIPPASPDFSCPHLTRNFT
ncbi:unnamed protein product [Schistocephalus solidus]|uniref:C2H2-type domain-containing protein n=1 Tax=Schistocephalus solidus TaxID=70667 RepID=A0A183TGB7_SCHSO|nr:unnamed protein product [Schistocephalus solidus]